MYEWVTIFDQRAGWLHAAGTALSGFQMVTYAYRARRKIMQPMPRPLVGHISRARRPPS